MALRILTYNIHSGLGVDRIRDYRRIGRFLAGQAIDICLLQEVDTRFDRVGKPPEDVLSDLAEGHFPHHVAAPSVVAPSGGWFGNAILSRFPVSRYAIIDSSVALREPRNIIDAVIATPGGALRVINTHKGLKRVERYSQLAKIEILLAEYPDLPLVVGGDINEWFYRANLLRRMAGAMHYCRVGATFPVQWPLIHLDRLWCRPSGLVKQAQCLRTPETRRYSDHYPVLAEIILPTSP